MNNSKNNRKLEIAAAISFFIATLTYATGNALVSESLTLGVMTNLGMGVFLELINSIAVILIGLLLYARLKSSNENLAFGYALSRIIEALLLIVGSSLALLASNVEGSSAISLLNYSHEVFFTIAMLMLGLYSTYFCIVLLRSSLAPKGLMILGAVGYFATVVYAVINIFALSSSASMLLFAPGAVFEIVFPLWLIIKGFK